MTGGERLLRRLLRRAEVVAALRDSGDDIAVTIADGKVLFGDRASDNFADIVANEKVLGHVSGERAGEVARLLGLLATSEEELRALAGESLGRYKELTMLYSISEKVIGAKSRAHVAKSICDEAARVLKSAGVTALLLNEETGRLESIASTGIPLLDRSGRDIGSDIVADVIASGSGEIVNDLAGSDRILDAAADFKSVACSPMRSGDSVVGVLVAGASPGREFTAGDLQILNAIAAHCASVMEVVRLDRDIRAMSRRPIDLIYSVGDRPPVGVTAALGFQHVLIGMLSIAYPVLVTLEAGGTRQQAASVVAMSLIAMAIATAIQALRSGPVGSGFLAPYITSAIFLGPSILAARSGGMGLVFGMTIVAGGVSLALSQILGRFRRLFPPEVSGVVVLMVGISMVPVAFTRLVGIGGADSVSEPREWVAGIVTLGTILIITVLAGRIKLYATAIGLGVGYLTAAALGLFDADMFEPLAELPVIGLLPLPSADLSVDPLLIIPFVAAAIASSVKDAGLLINAQKLNDPNWRHTDTRSMSGGLVAGGLGNIASGVLGGTGLGISAGSVGLAAATGATARVVGLAAAVIFLLLAFLPKFTAILALIPSPVMGAGLIYTACYLVSSGTELIASRMLDARRTYVIGLPLLAGVAILALPDLAGHFPPWAGSIASSPLAVTTILALGLNAFLNAGVSSRATATIRLDNLLGAEVAAFVDRKAASWGARRDVIDRVVPAITDLCEELREADGSEAIVELSFDEFRFIASVKSDVDTSSVIDDVLRTIDQRYDSISRTNGDGAARLEFIH